jgi:5-methylcytosine-specific restriction endonuclease McrA
MMKRDLAEQEADSFLDQLEEDPTKVQVKDKRQDVIRQLYFNQEFLRKKEQEQKLRCEYCGKSPLRRYPQSRENLKKMLLDVSFRPGGFNARDGATVDHREPRSKGGDDFDEVNLAVCCDRCNTIKGDMDYTTWKRMIGNH